MQTANMSESRVSMDDSKSRRLSNQSAQSDKLNPEFKLNPASDGRKMRRVIAEDPEWSLITVPLLSELCTKAIVKHFEVCPRHDELPLKYQKKVLAQIPTTLPLEITSSLISDEQYWERCCKAKFRINDVSKYGNSWKRMFFEREIKHLVENFIPNRTEWTKLNEIVRLGAPYVVKLDIQQLLPPIEIEQKEFNLDNENETDELVDDEPDQEKEESIKDRYQADHFDFSQLIPKLPNLAELRVVYGVRDCGMNFEWGFFEFTKKDCLVLARCVAQCHTLRALHVNWSKVDDDKVRLFISHILDHPSLVELNLAHNLISDRGCRAIGKLLNGHSRLERMSLCNNQIRALGALAIAHAITKNQTLRELDLRLNRLGDEGGQAIAKSLLKNTTLVRLNLASNNMTEPSAAIISSAIAQNTTIRYLDLSSNRLGPDGGKNIQEAMQENKTMLELDLRLTEVGQDSDFIISKILKKNVENDRNERIENENRVYKSFNRTFSHIF